MSKQKQWKNITAKALEAKLRTLAKPPIPQTLQRRLLAAIPCDGPKPLSSWQAGWHQIVRDFGATAAAAVLIFTLMILINYGLSPISSSSLFAGIEDMSLFRTDLQQSSFLCDQDNACVIKSVESELKWPTINHNEP